MIKTKRIHAAAYPRRKADTAPQLGPMVAGLPAAPVATVPPPVKGWQTSEFWITLVTAAATLLNASGLLGPVHIPTDVIVPVVSTVATYIGSRSLLKAFNTWVSAKANAGDYANLNK